jgi:hypothetical protein
MKYSDDPLGVFNIQGLAFVPDPIPLVIVVLQIFTIFVQSHYGCFPCRQPALVYLIDEISGNKQGILEYPGKAKNSD